MTQQSRTWPGTNFISIIFIVILIPPILILIHNLYTFAYDSCAIVIGAILLAINGLFAKEVEPGEANLLFYNARHTFIYDYVIKN